MWPFSKKVFGISKDRNGNFIVEITKREQSEIDALIDELRCQDPHAEIPKESINALTSLALVRYARNYLNKASEVSSESLRRIYAKRGLASMTKALQYYQVPIYLFESGLLCELSGHPDAAKQYFKNFLSEQSQFKPNKMDEFVLGECDIDQAINQAMEKMRYIL